MNSKQAALTAVSVVVVAGLVVSALHSAYLERDEDDGRLKVVASFYPLAFMAREIGGERVRVTSLIPENTELHGWQPSVSDIVEADEADVLLYNGAGLDMWVEDDLLPAISTSGKVVVEATDGVELVESAHPAVEAGTELFGEGPFGNLTAGPNASSPAEIGDGVCYSITLHGSNGTYIGHLVFTPDEDGEFAVLLDHLVDEVGFAVMDGNETVGPEEDVELGEEQVDEAHFRRYAVFDLEGDRTYSLLVGPCEIGSPRMAMAHLHEHGEHGGAGHTHGFHDPHTWISPFIARQQARSIYEALIEADPAGEDHYAERWSALDTALAELDAAYLEALADAPIHDIIVSHAAYGYLADRYGFHQHGVIGISGDEEPSVATLDGLAELMEEKGIHVIFVDPVYQTEYADTLGSEVGDRTGEEVRILHLYLMTGRVDRIDLLGQMEENLESLRIGLGAADA